MNETTGNFSPADSTDAARVVVAIEPEFMNVEDVIKVLRISEREIYRLIDDGELVSHPYKRRKLIDPASVHAFADRVRAGYFAKEQVA